jgi:class 3 adenylate cyclase
MNPQVRYTKTSDGVNIAWFAMGSGPAFLWVGVGGGPGAVASMRVPEFREMADFIARTATLIMYDSRGVGLSDRGSTEYSCEAIVGDMEAVATAAGVERFTLQGVGANAIPAIKYAARHSEQVAALLLPNGVLRGADMSTGWKQVARLAEEDWHEAAAWLTRMNIAGWASTGTIERMRSIVEKESSREAFVALARAIDQWDASEDAQGVTAPTLVSHYGTWQPLDACRRLAASLPNATFVAIELSPDERAVDAVSRVTVDFLRTALPRRPRAQPALPAERGTAIILFADIADSTAITERIGDDAFREKARTLDQVLRAAIRENGGSAVEGKTLGDGVLAVFTSAREAIGCAAACHVAAADADLALHVGIHAGDVIREADNVFGGAVNIAARVAAASAGGETLVSGTVRDLARTSAGVSFENRGEQQMKGISEPLRLFAVR